MLFGLALLTTLSLAMPFEDGHDTTLNPRKLTRTSRYAPLVKLDHSSQLKHLAASSHNTLVRASYQGAQRVIEVQFNNIPRYLLLDTGSADTWMISSHFQCLNVSEHLVPRSQCAFGDPYTGTAIRQIGNETFDQIYGTGETLYGAFGYANVTVASLTVAKQKVALVNRGYGLGDHVRSGVVGLAPRAITRLFTNTNASTTAPNGNVTPYSPIFESMYSSMHQNPQDPIAPLFSLALERGAGGGYLAFGGLPPIEFAHDFTFAPFRGLNYYGRYHPERYYPIQPDGFELNGVRQATKYRAVVDSGTAVNRLPRAIADRVNSHFNPPAIYNAEYDLYVTSCNATSPSFSFRIGNKNFVMHSQDMFLPISSRNQCFTSFTRGFSFGSKAYPEGFFVLGEAFLNGVVAVFDVGKEGMWFTGHEY